jgi:hypothetical protein
MAKGKGQSKGHGAPLAAMSFLQVFETGSGQDRPSRIGRPYSDQFDVAAVSAAIAAGETTPLRAYQAYAATAGRPYARWTFEQIWRDHAKRVGGASAEHAIVSIAEACAERRRNLCPVGGILGRACRAEAFTGLDLDQR